MPVLGMMRQRGALCVVRHTICVLSNEPAWIEPNSGNGLTNVSINSFEKCNALCDFDIETNLLLKLIIDRRKHACVFGSATKRSLFFFF